MIAFEKLQIKTPFPKHGTFTIFTIPYWLTVFISRRQELPALLTNTLHHLYLYFIQLFFQHTSYKVLFSLIWRNWESVFLGGSFNFIAFQRISLWEGRINFIVFYGASIWDEWLMEIAEMLFSMTSEISSSIFCCKRPLKILMKSFHEPLLVEFYIFTFSQLFDYIVPFGNLSKTLLTFVINIVNVWQKR